jgi:hypothetical protein
MRDLLAKRNIIKIWLNKLNNNQKIKRLFIKFNKKFYLKYYLSINRCIDNLFMFFFVYYYFLIDLYIFFFFILFAFFKN